MTDDMTRPASEDAAGEAAGATTGAPAEPGATGEAGAAGDASAGEALGVHVREWMTQLQGMIDRIAHEAAPVARQVAAKAAELAALAGDKAGPLAKKAAEVTEDVGSRVAVRGRQLADGLRHPSGDGHEAAADAPAPDAGTADAAEATDVAAARD